MIRDGGSQLATKNYKVDHQRLFSTNNRFIHHSFSFVRLHLINGRLVKRIKYVLMAIHGFTNRMKLNRRKLYITLFWIVITLIVLYDRRFLIQKVGLGHFAECTVVRVILLMALSYVNLKVLMPRLLEQGRWLVYGFFLASAVLAYLLVQQAYDIYLYGLVLGDGDYTFQGISFYLAITTLWYLVLTVVFYKALDWY
ncbi:MAG: hypothetical protein ACKODM_02960, partial [Cytophagales bacterium]